MVSSIQKLQRFVYKYKGNIIDNPDRDVSDYELLKMFGDFYVGDDPDLIDYMVGLFEKGNIRDGFEMLNEYLSPDSPIHYRCKSLTSFYNKVMEDVSC